MEFPKSSDTGKFDNVELIDKEFIISMHRWIEVRLYNGWNEMRVKSSAQLFKRRFTH